MVGPKSKIHDFKDKIMCLFMKILCFYQGDLKPAHIIKTRRSDTLERLVKLPKRNIKLFITYYFLGKLRKRKKAMELKLQSKLRQDSDFFS